MVKLNAMIRNNKAVMSGVLNKMKQEDLQVATVLHLLKQMKRESRQREDHVEC